MIMVADCISECNFDVGKPSTGKSATEIVEYDGQLLIRGKKSLQMHVASVGA